MASRNFAHQVGHVQPGSPVSASNTSQATRDLENRTNYLKEIVDSIEAGQLLVRKDQKLHADVQEGDAVFWDDEAKQFDRAIAAVENDPATSVFVPKKSADCLGLCLVKSSATGGTIATVGMAKLPATTLASVTEGDATPGRYYLSSANPGKLTRQRPAVTVAVAFVLGPTDDCETDAWVFILPQMRDFLEDHIHYQFNLTASPAGTHTPPLVDEDHVITTADSTAQGWLPADDAIFSDTAPTGAKFGYNLAAHTALNQVWPPLPPGAAILEMFKPLLSGAPSRFEGLARVTNEYLTIDAHGIWWMTSCYNQVPWETTLDTTSSASSSASASSVAQSCPAESPVTLILSFLKMTFATDKTVVTSLQPRTGEPIRYVNCDGQDAQTGDLHAILDVQALLDETSVRGSQALKQIVSSQLLFQQGWIAEALIAGSDEVVLSGTHQELLDPDAPASGTNPLIHQGIVTVNVQLDPLERELNPQVVKLGDALSREHKNVTYLGFPTGRDSGIRMMYNVPPSGLPSNPKLKIRAIIFGRAAGPLAAMTMSYYRIIRPVAGTPTPISEGDTTIAFDVVTPSDDIDGGGTDLPVDTAIEVESAEFTVAAGDTVYVTLTRAAAAVPLFQADIGVIRVGGVIVPGA